MMKKISIACFVFSLIVPVCYGQQPFRFSQYFQNAVTVNPAVAGVEDFMDLKVGYRQQWTGIDLSPQTFYLSAHAPLSAKPSEFLYRNNALRISDPEAFDQLETRGAIDNSSNVRHGVGGYVLNDQQGVFQQTSAFGTYAAHLRVGPRTRLSVGLAAGINNNRIDTDGLTVGNDRDPTLSRILNQSGGNASLDLNAGLLLYSETYYVGYSADRILRNPITETTDSTNERQNVYHYGLFGLRLRLNDTWLLMPGAFVGASSGLPLTYDLNVRLRYEELLWIGASYRNTGTIAGMLGLNVNNRFNINYAYDYGVSAVRDFRSGTHEIVLGFILFNPQDNHPYLW